MDSKGRSNFWEKLEKCHNNSKEQIDNLVKASKQPKMLCRFRSVNEQTLQQLQENKLFFSSADHYDDPFDTYFYINVEQMSSAYNDMKEALSNRNKEFEDSLKQISILTGQDSNTFVEMLSKELLNFEELKGTLKEIRNSIQCKLFSICFCENPYNETLWLKYANNYAGFVQIYDLDSLDTILCGKEDACKNCIMAEQFPYLYPMYYSDEKYDATKFAVGVFLMDKIIRSNNANLKPLYNYVQNSLMWEIERISLIKKKCHENDQEWRMIRPAVGEQRSLIKMRPSKVIIGLRTPEYESRLIVSVAKIAGVNEIHKLYINETDELDSKPIYE